MRESNAIFSEIKYDLRKCLECDDIFTPAYRHPHQKFCKNPICCHHRDARRKSLSHQRLMRNPAYRAGTGAGNTTFKFRGTSSCNIIIFQVEYITGAGKFLYSFQVFL